MTQLNFVCGERGRPMLLLAMTPEQAIFSCAIGHMYTRSKKEETMSKENNEENSLLKSILNLKFVQDFAEQQEVSQADFWQSLRISRNAVMPSKRHSWKLMLI